MPAAATTPPLVIIGDHVLAESRGFATFNEQPHLMVEAPPEGGSFTVTVKTSDGKRVTFGFQAYHAGGPQKCVDVLYHDSGKSKNNGGSDLAAFDIFLASGGSTPYDSRKNPEQPVTLAIVLLGD